MKTSVRLAAIFVMLSVVIGQLGVPPAGAADSTKNDAAKTTVPVFRLIGSILETPEDESIPLSSEKKVALKDLIERLHQARDDKDVKTIVVTVEDLSAGGAQIEEIRQALAEIRNAGKEIYAHADSLSLGQYLLVSGANKLSVAPTGTVLLMGLHSESPYLRGLLNLIGVTPDFLTCGAYKSAAEVFMREGPSPQSEEMTNWILDSYYETIVKDIAEGRGADQDKVRKWIDGGLYTASGAKEAGLIDEVQHRQDFDAQVKKRFEGGANLDRKYGQEDKQEIDLSSPMGVLSFYADLLGGKKVKSHRKSVAIVYVEGPIVLGDPESSVFEAASTVAASTRLRKALTKAANDDSVKAVVLRVNSPGGSATASEIILNATKLVKAKKPLVVSMGNVAGSGGYYVACGADTIFADDLTITGSIGVVGGKLATTEMWNKIGINWKEYNRGANADLLSSSRTFTPEQRKKVQDWMDELYGVFKGHVTTIRGDRLKKPIDEIAGGRVYTGRQALDLGLVDKIGSLDDAVKFVADQAKLEAGKFELRVIPEPKNFLEKILESATGGDEDEEEVSLRPVAPGGNAGLLNAALPHLRNLDGLRVDAVIRSLRQLETLHAEGVILMTPEIVFPQLSK